METGGFKYKRCFYEYEPSKSKDSKIRYYINSSCNTSFDNMTESIVKIEYDKKCYDVQSKTVYRLFFRTSTNWKRCQQTALIRHNKTWCFLGDISVKSTEINPTTDKFIQNPTHFIIVEFSEDANLVAIDFFSHFYPYKKGLRDLIMSIHNYAFSQKKELIA